MKNNPRGAMILVLADDQEIRDGIGALLGSDGYCVNPVGNVEDAIDTIKRNQPDLILVSLGQSGDETIAIAHRLRVRAGLNEGVPIVLFCILTVAPGAAVEVEENTYATRPDNFNQLRTLLGRLLERRPASF